MDDLFWLILLFPLLWPFVAKVWLKATLNWQEVGLNVVIAVALTAVAWYGGRYAETRDVEIWNGHVTAKQQERVSCEHSYQCNCRTVSTGTGKNRSTTTHCDTCYEHSHDYDWVVKSNAGDFTIARVDRQGVHEPPRWSRVRIGEPVAREHGYTNWVKGAAHSLFNEGEALAEDYAGMLPAYPEVYDYHRADRVIPLDVDLPDRMAWNQDLSERLIRLGPEKQANVVMVMTDSPSEKYATALKTHWQGAKKNDIVIVIGAPNAPEIAWVDVFSWSKTDIVNIELRDRLMDIGTLDHDRVIDAIDDTIYERFIRRPMAEFEYLKHEIEPPVWVIVLMTLFAIPGSLALTWLFHRHDVRLFRR